MKHSPSFLTAEELYCRLFEESDSWDVFESLCTEELLNDEKIFNEDLLGKWYYITWPEHVITCRYNSDCVIAGPFDAMAKALYDAGYSMAPLT